MYGEAYGPQFTDQERNYGVSYAVNPEYSMSLIVKSPATQQIRGEIASAEQIVRSPLSSRLNLTLLSKDFDQMF